MSRLELQRGGRLSSSALRVLAFTFCIALVAASSLGIASADHDAVQQAPGPRDPFAYCNVVTTSPRAASASPANSIIRVACNHAVTRSTTSTHGLVEIDYELYTWANAIPSTATEDGEQAAEVNNRGTIYFTVGHITSSGPLWFVASKEVTYPHAGHLTFTTIRFVPADQYLRRAELVNPPAHNVGAMQPQRPCEYFAGDTQPSGCHGTDNGSCDWEMGGVVEADPQPCLSMPVQRVHLVTDTATAAIKAVEVTNFPPPSTEIAVNNFPTQTVVDASGSHVTATVDNTEANPVPVTETSSQTVTTVGGWEAKDSEHLERITLTGIVFFGFIALVAGIKLILDAPFGKA